MEKLKIDVSKIVGFRHNHLEIEILIPGGKILIANHHSSESDIVFSQKAFIKLHKQLETIFEARKLLVIQYE